MAVCDELQEAEEASQELDKLLSAAAKEGKLKKVYKVGNGCCPAASSRIRSSRQ
jgi:hypothetical protein